jgi:uncharacterized protein YjbI with pentapeptide repeats
LHKISWIIEGALMKLEHVRESLEAKKCNLAGSIFDDVNLANVVVENVNLSHARLHDVNLSHLQITNACCHDVSISDAALDGMTINGVLVTDLFAAYRSQQHESPQQK